MIKRWRWGQYRFSISASKVVDVKGVNSILPDGHHILMWDFDEAPHSYVLDSLRKVQRVNRLPPILVLNTGKPHHYIAYCFKRHRFREALQIMASTEGIDVSFLKYGIYRGHWTLRITPKSGRKIKLARILTGFRDPDASPAELNSFVAYESTNP